MSGMRCTNHPDGFAVARCSGCSEPFCGTCMVNLRGQQYCASCKVMAVPDPAAALADEQPLLKEAKDAFILSIVGLLCCGFILEPIALYKAIEARKTIQNDPTLGGEDMAIAAIVISGVGSAFYLFAVLAQLMA